MGWVWSLEPAHLRDCCTEWLDLWELEILVPHVIVFAHGMIKKYLCLQLVGGFRTIFVDYQIVFRLKGWDTATLN